MEASNLPHTELKTLDIGLLNELRGRIDELSKNFHKEIISIKKDIETIKKEPVRNEEYNN